MSDTATAAELKAIGSAVYNYELMIGQMYTIEGITPEQIAHERGKLAMAKRGLKKLRAARRDLRQPVAHPVEEA